MFLGDGKITFKDRGEPVAGPGQLSLAASLPEVADPPDAPAADRLGDDVRR